MASPIPEAWRKDLIRILRSNDPQLIHWTRPARQIWEADTFGDAQEYEAYDAMIAAIAIANELPLYTVNPADFEGVAGLDLRRIEHPDQG